jgi:hypothetical protein
VFAASAAASINAVHILLMIDFLSSLDWFDCLTNSRPPSGAGSSGRRLEFRSRILKASANPAREPIVN